VTVTANHSTAGAGDVVLVADSGAIVTSVNGFTYLEESTIDSVLPSSGQEGTIVVIIGQRLLGGGDSIVSASLAGVTADALLDSNDTHVSVRAGAGNDTIGDILLTSDSGAITTKANGFAYIVQGSIELVSPNKGQLGTYVTIFGVGLFGGGANVTSLKLGGVPVLSFQLLSSNTIKVRADKSTSLGFGDVEIFSTSGATIVLENGWTYDPPSNITSVCV